MPAPDGLRIQAHRRIPLAEIDAIVAARLGPGRVPGNAQPAAFSRHVAMYLASAVGSWSTTQIGKFYNGRDHSTVCYAITRIRVRRQSDQTIDELLTLLESEITQRGQSERGSKPPPKVNRNVRPDASLVPEFVLEALAERIASRVLSHLAELRRVNAVGHQSQSTLAQTGYGAEEDRTGE